MLTLYLACLVLGGFFVALSVFGADAGVGSDLDTDMGSELGADGGEVTARFLGVRNVVFFVAFFGLTGTLLTLLSVPLLLTPVLAVGMGLVAATGIHRLMGFLQRDENGQIPDADHLEGRMAQVIVDVGVRRPGKVDVVVGDRTYQFLARIHEGAAVDHAEAGDTVVVVRIQDGTALVADKSYLV